MSYKFKRLYFLIIFGSGIALAIFFILKALEEKIVFFYSPSEILVKEIDHTRLIRIGGLVLDESISYEKDGLVVSFTVTDNKNNVQVNYKGILPDLFREGQGVVAEGKIDTDNKIFYAEKVLAKHDENYMPPEVKKIISD
ncbi:MAG: Cytochrome c-type biogenesis protein CcmE [Alphaproteobacteria bacterium MarineAlpha9_Bin4]|nr:cytochrome c maturation protein CcmE [Pelagibacterales bacterium]PPR27387.1 MAG: Cytochrome c-type biogenesis protein CcmE [Alphaproteobacteria bacterium MarineAlpha9_Bin4]|tara:strand:- start:1604 stop:2023 length:420 start_codon:yes stop_codon:yes gene_type:complete